MGIGKVRSNCEAERDIIVQGFKDSLRVLKQAKNQIEIEAKASLYDIINDKTLSDEERYDQEKPFYEMLSEQEETDIRIRRTLLIGMFSFWELSLKEICEFYKLDLATENGIEQNKKQRNGNEQKNKKPHYNYNDYANAIFQSERPEIVNLINSEIKELRNYMTHGTAKADRIADIENLMNSHPEFCIGKACPNYFFTSYDGLENILKVFSDGLICAEDKAKIAYEQTKKA